jgi:hypothetical protein
MSDNPFGDFYLKLSTDAPEGREDVTAVDGSRYARMDVNLTGDPSPAQRLSGWPNVTIYGFLLSVPAPSRRHPIKRFKARRFNKAQKFTVISG